MVTLYNCRHSGDQYRITKFDSDMNPQASYLCTLEECECPAGVRPMCRHRQMLPRFITRGHVGDEWFFDFDRGGWVQMGDEWKRQEPAMNITATEIDERMKQLAMPSRDLTEQLDALSGIIEKALNETGYVKEPPSPTHMKRRF